MPDQTDTHGRNAALLWVWIGAVAITGLSLLALHQIAWARLMTSTSVPWWILAVIFCVAEVERAQLRYRHGPPPFSLSAIPLVLGLFFTPAFATAAALLAGAVAALVIHRRAHPLSLALAAARAGLTITVAESVLAAFTALGGRDLAMTAAGAVVAVVAAETAAASLTVVAAAALEHHVDAKHTRVILIRAIVGTLATSAVALLAVLAVINGQQLAWLLLVAMVAAVIALRTSTADRSRFQRLQSLYSLSRTLDESLSITDAVAALSGYATAAFGADMVEITVTAAAQSEPIAHSTIWTTQPHPSRETATADLGAFLKPSDGPLLLPSTSQQAAHFLRERGLDCAMGAVLQAQDQSVGSVSIGLSLGGLDAFTKDDLGLFLAFVDQATTVLHTLLLHNHLRLQAFHDELTGLATRTLFHQRVVEVVEHDSRGQRPFALLLLDLDDFKAVNDTLGHTTGDRLLHAVAGRLSAALRDGDVAARLGGDEFAVLLADCQPQEATVVAERILAALERPFKILGESLRVHASMGVVVTRAQFVTVDRLLANADVAMYEAKARGKGRYEVFQPRLQASVNERQSLKVHLETAVERNELVVHYQPLVDLDDNRFIGLEALVRWRHPERGLMMPIDFIPLAEDTGMILAVGRSVLSSACRQVAAWQTLYPGLTISVNLSPREVHDGDIVASVAEVLRETQLDPGSLVLEITEGLMMDRSSDTVAKLQALKQLGVRLAVDDFGTGYSSLSMLRSMPVDILKIPKPFVDGLGTDPGQEAFAEAIVKLGSTLQLRMVAEGIERDVQARWLRALGCDIGQGYHFARPLAAADMNALLNVSLPRPGAHLGLIVPTTGAHEVRPVSPPSVLERRRIAVAS